MSKNNLDSGLTDIEFSQKGQGNYLTTWALRARKSYFLSLK